MRIREPWPEARSRQRRREFEPLFREAPSEGLGDALEIGGGDGYVASLVAGACRTLVSSDLHPREPAAGTEAIPRVTCDAAHLPFPAASFDLVFSSSALEHIRDRGPVYREMDRCLRRGGLMIHVMPSRTWKLLQLLFYYPNILIGGVDLLLDASSGGARASHGSKIPSKEYSGQWEGDARLPTVREALRGIVPTVHGEYASHLHEWQGFGVEAWADEFSAAGFEVRRVIRLPLYSGYGFGLERLRSWGERRGWSSHNAFVMTRAGEEPSRGRWFEEVRSS